MWEAELYSGTIGTWGVEGVRLTYSGKSWEVDAIGFEGRYSLLSLQNKGMD